MSTARLFGISLLAGFFLLSCPSPSLAHTLKTDGNIGGLLHVDPTDEPFAKSPATIYFELTDKTARISPANCECEMTVERERKQLSTQALYTQDSTSLETQIPYTFPEPGIYELKFLGRLGSEQFNLSFDVRVQPAAQLTDKGESESHTGHYIIFGVGGLVLLGYLLYTSKREPSVIK